MVGKNDAIIAHYSSAFSKVLRAGERLLNAGAAIYLLDSEMLGRGKGDGTLGLTNLRVIHAGLPHLGLKIERADIVSVSKKWIVIPGSSQLNISYRSDGAVRQAEFYCGTGFCKEIISLLGAR